MVGVGSGENPGHQSEIIFCERKLEIGGPP